MSNDIPTNNCCPKCSSRHWMRDVNVSFDVSLWVPVSTFKSATSIVVADVCGECGYTEFRAKSHQALWEAWSKRNQ